jgi:hypothetical protein
MIDLETWGLTPGSMLRSIGAVVFDPVGARMGSTFYANIDEASQEAVGLTRDGETVLWWTEQSFDAQELLEEDQRPLHDVLAEFTSWWKMAGGQHPWSHGANFDIVLLESAYRACGLEHPWKFWDVRCCRTVLALGNRRAYVPKGGVKHHALTDAKAQAVAVAAALESQLPVQGWR